ncbi:MAG: hypothetical protein FWF67_01665 [Fibromonadales bacterium]|nr:hypothetical protein [Fibromonadales bacterium]
MLFNRLIFAFLAVVLCTSLFFSCTSDVEMPQPPLKDKYSSSSLVALSSSSLKVSSSSSSSPAALSSSSLGFSSSSSSSPVVLSSSSLEFSSSSVDVSSSSSSESSSSVASSSSSVVSSSSAVSSSSLTSSSSSVVTDVESCDGFVDGTPREHYGKSKAQFCDSRDGKKYVYVTIGEQYWMAENLNYNASGSRCYGDNTGGDSQGNCAIYGRLYNWATAMNIPSSYNSSSYNPSPSIKYRGVCPEGWHLPSNAEWDKLMRYVDGTSGTESPYTSETAGKHLKAKESWSNCGYLGSGKTYLCEDTYGFSALAGGYGSSLGDGEVDLNGRWWSASEYDNRNAYRRLMGNTHERVTSLNYGKSYLFSVRCLQD